MNILNKIVRTKKREIKIQKKNKSLKQMREECFAFLEKPKTKKNERSLKQAIKNASQFGLISEIKLASPSAGQLTTMNYIDIARLYAKSKTDVISILTDKTYFDGDISYLKKVRKICHQPIFRKDFIIDVYQIYETALAHGDAFLLIASILTKEEIKKFITLGKKLGLECLIETHNKTDIKKTVQAGAEIIGINNRNLKTMTIDLDTTIKLAKYIPNEKLIISESGIGTGDDVKKLIKFGIDGILVGTSIINSKNIIKKIAALKKCC